MSTNSFYNETELLHLGFKSIGKNVRISKYCRIYNPNEIEISDNARIDDFCLLSGKIKIGKYVHIGAYSSFFAGNASIELSDFCSISSRCAFYAVTDDYSGEFLTNPTVPNEYRNVCGGPIFLDKHVIIGTGTTVFPNLSIGEGVAVGAMSLVQNNLRPWGIYFGVPCKQIKIRSKQVLELESEFLSKNINNEFEWDIVE